MGAGAGRPDSLQFWAMRLRFKAPVVDLGLRCAS
jgi:hypothetical protein